MKAQKNTLEWAVFAISLALILAVVAILLRSGATTGQAPPALSVTAGSPSPAPGGHQIPVLVRNEGQSVEEARIEVSLMQGDAVVERAELMIEFVPEKSEREGWVVFQRDPRCCTVTARAVAFEKP